MQKERLPEDSYLYSLRGFQFCDLLLSRGKYREVQKRVEWSTETRSPSDSLLSIALENLSIGRAHLLQELEEETNDFTLAENYLNQAVEGLREAGYQHILPLGLLARFTLNRVRQNFCSAWSDLEEAREIAEQGSMRIHLADYHLEAARLHLAREQPDKAGENLEIAKTMIEEMGYHRRDGEVGELNGMISGFIED
ncbi:MAG: hypothetical protein GY852_07765 [bacterium]|nr:hypothetical protein [bacterium]